MPDFIPSDGTLKEAEGNDGKKSGGNDSLPRKMGTAERISSREICIAIPEGYTVKDGIVFLDTYPIGTVHPFIPNWMVTTVYGDVVLYERDVPDE